MTHLRKATARQAVEGSNPNDEARMLRGEMLEHKLRQQRITSPVILSASEGSLKRERRHQVREVPRWRSE